MADIGTAVHTYLQSKSAVTTLCSTRGFPNNPKKGVARPYYVYALISSTHDKYLRGVSGIAFSRIQIDCYADRALDAYALHEQIRLAMMAQGPLTMGTVVVDDVTQEGDTRTSESPPDAGDAWLYRYSTDYMLAHDEAIPA